MIEDKKSLEADAVDDETNFVRNMQKLREQRGWSQGELARRMQEVGWTSFHQTTVSRIEQGLRPVRLGESRGIAEVLGSSVDQMIRPGDGSENIRQLEKLVEEAKRIRRDIYASIQELHSVQT